ncbi:MAG: metallophosphoesterase family protein [Bacteroidales bacterium]
MEGRLVKCVLIVFLSGILFIIAPGCHKPIETDLPEYKPVLSEILSRPESKSVTINVMADTAAELYYEYGTTPGTYTFKTSVKSQATRIPAEIVIENLTPSTEYFYRSRIRSSGSNGEYSAGTEHSFRTCRAAGSTFRFAIEADPHLDYNSDTAAYALTLRNILAADVDFMLDLGDTFMSEKLPSPILQGDIISRHQLLRSYFDNICHSVPLFLVLGNHEGELGWRNTGTMPTLPVMVSNTRKYYFSNPLPDQFYSGNSTNESSVGIRQNYYAWEWGDALFVVLDPFWYSVSKPGWGYTLGKQQYDWFKQVLAQSDASYKFVFSHNLVGGYGNDARGGAEYAHLFEMGGYNADSTYGFDTYRPGWGKPIHELMKEFNVTAFFHGHDHFYGKQEKDGIVYQEVPQPSNRNTTNISAADYGYRQGTLLPGRGYVLVTVSPGAVKLEYVGTFLPSEVSGTKTNKSIIHSYIIN